jgi:preprotein translocase subunit SecA
VLEGRHIDELIFNYIGDSVEDAVRTYLSRDYVPEQVAAWCRQAFGVPVDAHKLRAAELDDLQDLVREQVRDEVQQTVSVTLGEYLSNDMLPEDWDVTGVSQWAKTQFGVDLPAGELRQMNVDEIRIQLIEAANQRVDQKDLSELAKFIDPLFGAKALAEWAEQKFSTKLDPQSLVPKESERPQEATDRVIDTIIDEARKQYDKRAVDYPIEFIMELAFRGAQQDQNWAVAQLVGWAKQRFDLDWNPDEVITWQGAEIRKRLHDAAEPWVKGNKAEQLADKALAEHKTPAALVEWTRTRLGIRMTPDEFEGGVDKRPVLIGKIRQMLRTELGQLERFVLLQILDTAWKDHLYAMDQLRDSVRLRAYSEKDPRIEYKREGSHAFEQMQQSVRDRVTELIFRARLTPEVRLRNVYETQQAQHAEAPSAIAAAAAQRGTAQQQADIEAADRAGQPSPDDGGGDDDGDDSRDAVKRAQRQRDRRKKSR